MVSCLCRCTVCMVQQCTACGARACGACAPASNRLFDPILCWCLAAHPATMITAQDTQVAVHVCVLPVFVPYSPHAKQMTACATLSFASPQDTSPAGTSPPRRFGTWFKHGQFGTWFKQGQYLGTAHGQALTATRTCQQPWHGHEWM